MDNKIDNSQPADNPQASPTPPSQDSPTPTPQQAQPIPTPQDVQATPAQTQSTQVAPQPPMKIPQPPTANKKLLAVMGGAMVVLLGIVIGIFFFVLGGQDTGEASKIASQEEIMPLQSQSLEEQAENIVIEGVEEDIKKIEQELENL